MIHSRVARRYAAALFQLGRERGELEGYVADLEGIVRALDEQPALRSLLENPRIQPRRKEELLRQSFGGVSEAVRNLLRLLVRKRREAYVRAIWSELVRMRDEAEGIARAEARVAVELAPQEVDALRQRLERALGRRLRLQVRVQPELIGGLVVQIGDRRLDASLRRRLQALRERIAAGDGGVRQREHPA